MVDPYNQYSSMFSPQQQYHNSSYQDEDDYYSHNYLYPSSSSSSSSSVDCTLSLGTPSTRFTPGIDNTINNYDYHQPNQNHRNISFCWDLLHTTPAKQPSPKPHRTSNSSGATSDPLLSRRCANCDTTSTPLWRNGPRGPKSLCNACGIRFKKEERRAAATTNTAVAAQNGAGMMDPNNQYGYYNNGSWANQYGQATPQKMQCFGAPNEFRFMEDDRGSDGTGIQFLSWLTHDRPSGLVHDFTR